MEHTKQVNRLRVVRDTTDYDKGILGIIAPTRSEAKQYGIMELCMDNYIDAGCKVFKGKHNIDLSIKRVIEPMDGLKNGVYGWIEDNCELCGQYDRLELQDDGSAKCSNCDNVPHTE